MNVKVTEVSKLEKNARGKTRALQWSKLFRSCIWFTTICLEAKTGSCFTNSTVLSAYSKEQPIKWPTFRNAETLCINRQHGSNWKTSNDESRQGTTQSSQQKSLRSLSESRPTSKHTEFPNAFILRFFHKYFIQSIFIPTVNLQKWNGLAQYLPKFVCEKISASRTDGTQITKNDSLQQYYLGNLPLYEVCLMNTTFRELGLLPTSGEWLSLYWQNPRVGDIFVFRWLSDWQIPKCRIRYSTSQKKGNVQQNYTNPKL